SETCKGRHGPECRRQDSRSRCPRVAGLFLTQWHARVANRPRREPTGSEPHGGRRVRKTVEANNEPSLRIADAMTPKKPRSFDARAFLESAGLGKQVVKYARGDVIFSQGDPCDSVMYIRSGAIQLSVLSHAGREAIVGSLGAGDFLGEGALAGHPVRLATAKAAMTSAVLVVPKRQM